MTKSVISDLLLLAGIALTAYGVSLYSRPAAFIFVGTVSIAVSIFLGYAPAAKRRQR